MNIKCSVLKKIDNQKIELANWNCIACHAQSTMSRASGFAVVPTLDIAANGMALESHKF